MVDSEKRITGKGTQAKVILSLGIFLVIFLVIFLYVKLSATSIENNSRQDRASMTNKTSEDTYLTDYFKDKRYTSDNEDEFLQNDPFADACEGAPKGAVLFGGVVCNR